MDEAYAIRVLDALRDTTAVGVRAAQERSSCPCPACLASSVLLAGAKIRGSGRRVKAGEATLEAAAASRTMGSEVDGSRTHHTALPEHD